MPIKKYFLKKVIEDKASSQTILKAKDTFPIINQIMKIPSKNLSTKEVFDPLPILDSTSAVVKEPIAILVLVCNRPSVIRCLTNLVKYRPSADLFPIIISQDCGISSTKEIIKSNFPNLTLIEQPDQSTYKNLTGKKKNLHGYFVLCRHYKWALNQVMHKFGYNSVIIVEDDLEVSPDFFEYFSATYPILMKDKSLYCVSAWNDNGKPQHVNIQRPDIILRTDFFPGLGWMMLKKLWLELEPKWPDAFWDDWLRQPEQRLGRNCLYPEISRTYNFGRIGVSGGMHYDKHLKHILKFDGFVPFTKFDLSILIGYNYDEYFMRTVYSSYLLDLNGFKDYNNLTNIISESISNIVSNKNIANDVSSFRINLKNIEEYKKIANKLNIMDDLKSGIPRTAYRGIVTIFFKYYRLFLAPQFDWKGYQNN